MIWLEKAFSQVGKRSRERARAIRAWCPFHKIHIRAAWMLPPEKVNSTQWWNTSPHKGLLWKTTLAFFLPMPLLCIGWCSSMAAQCSLGPACVQGFSVPWKSLQTSSHVQKPDRDWKCLFFHKLEWATYRELGISGPDDNLTNSTKHESGICLLAKINLLSHGTLGSIGVCSGKPP